MTQAIIPNAAEFVELAGTNKGKLFRKQILRKGESFVHPANPNMKIEVDDNLLDKLVENFEKGLCDTVQFPLVDEKNRHVEDPARNLGQVVGLTKEDDGLYTTIDVRKNADDIGSTVLGASAMFSLNYTDTKTGQKVGPTLLHVAATNRPYLTKLAPYEAVALSADSDTECVVLSRVDDSSGTVSGANSESEPEMTLEEMLSELKSEHGIDVEALQAREENATDTEALVTALSNVLTAADSDLVALSNVSDTPSVTDIADAIVELSSKYADAAEQLDTLQLSAVESEVDSLVREGKVLPKQREAMVKLAMSDRETFDALVPENSLVSLSEIGVMTHEQPGGSHFEQAVSEVDRLLKINNQS